MKRCPLFYEPGIVFVFFVILLIYSFVLAGSKEGIVLAEQPAQDKQNIHRNVMIELFINAECTTCPKAAFCLEELAWTYEPGQVILLEAHIWGDGYDIPQTNERYNWYIGDGEKGTPDAFFNGLSQRIQGLCCDCGDIDENYAGYQQIIEDELVKSSPIEISAEIVNLNGKIVIQGKIANQSHSLLKNLILNGMVYYEGEESELLYLVKDIFDAQDICQLSPGEVRNFSFISHLEFSGFAEEEFLKHKGVIFIQDRLTKEILQSFIALNKA